MKNLLKEITTEAQEKLQFHSKQYFDLRDKFAKDFLVNPTHTIQWLADEIATAQQSYVEWERFRSLVGYEGMTDDNIEEQIEKELVSISERLFRGYTIDHSTNEFKNALSLYETKATGEFILHARRMVRQIKSILIKQNK